MKYLGYDPSTMNEIVQLFRRDSEIMRSFAVRIAQTKEGENINFRGLYAFINAVNHCQPETLNKIMLLLFDDVGEFYFAMPELDMALQAAFAGRSEAAT